MILRNHFARPKIDQAKRMLWLPKIFTSVQALMAQDKSSQDWRTAMTAQKPQGQVTERRFSWQFLLLGILDIIIALLAFRDPHATLGSVVYYFGFMAIFQGCTILFMANAVSRYFGIKNIWINISGIISIVAGIFILSNALASVMALPFVFAVWFIADAISDLLRTVRINRVKRAIWPGASAFNIWSVGTEIITLILGVYMLFRPGTAALTIVFLIGFYFLMKGISSIIMAFV